MDDKYRELLIVYNRILDLLKEDEAKVDELNEVELFLQALTVRMWAMNKMYSTDYKNALEALSGKKYSQAQITMAMDCAGEANRMLNIPKVIKNSNQKEQLLDTIGEYLVSASFINGDFTMNEAVAWSEIMNLIKNEVLEDYHFALDPKKKVTRLNESSYAKPSLEIKKSKTKDNSSEEKNDLKEVNEEISTTIQETIESFLNFKDEHTDNKFNKNNHDEEKGDDYFAKEVKQDNRTLESLLEELDSLIGLETVKKDVHSLLNFIKIANIRKSKGMKVPTISYHLVFTGNPGTGKTTIARLIAQLYYKMGLLSTGQLIETDRSALVAGYLGQTAIKTQKVIQQALGGVLFIDEAYSLAKDNEDSYGQEAIETLLKAMEDYRDELVVIVAGYDELMHRFIDSNPGLRSRFNKYFHFPDYVGEELVAIFERFCTNNGYLLDEESKKYLSQEFNTMYENRDDNFGNARTVRNVFENAIRHQANRLAYLSDYNDRDLMCLNYQDVHLAIMEVLS